MIAKLKYKLFFTLRIYLWEWFKLEVWAQYRRTDMTSMQRDKILRMANIKICNLRKRKNVLCNPTECVQRNASGPPY